MPIGAIRTKELEMSLSKFQKNLSSVAVLSVGVFVGAVAQAASTGARETYALPDADHKFVEKAAMGGMVEVDLGKLAQQKGASDQVKQFGSKMVEDHSKANDELKQVAKNKVVDLPTSLDSAHQKDMDKLSKLSGAEFDRAYMKNMLADHKEDISDFKKESRSGKDKDVRAFADKILPTLQAHLKMAQSVNDAVQAKK